MNKIAISLLMLALAASSFSQKIMMTIGRDTAWIYPENIGRAIDSARTAHMLRYEAERKRLRDSLEREAALALKRAPTLYYQSSFEMDGKTYSYIEAEQRPDSSLVASVAHDSIKTFSLLSMQALDSISKLRRYPIQADSSEQEDFRKETLIEMVGKKRGILAKDEFEGCECRECVAEVLSYISCYKRFWKRLLSDKTTGIDLCVYRSRECIFISVCRHRGAFFVCRTIRIEE